MPTTKTSPLLPSVFQTVTNQKFLNATLDQLVTEPNLKPLNGYVGRKFAPGFSSISDYVREPDAARADYQLEPSVVVKNTNTAEVEFHVTYPEVLQKINYYGGNIANPGHLWSSEYYSYTPHINLDAFINFGQYYWLPNGPDSVPVISNLVELEKTFYVYPDSGLSTYNLSGFGTISNPDLVLTRGGTYKFIVNQTGKPFWIQSDPGISGLQTSSNNLSSREILGVTNNGEDAGTVTFTVPDKTAQDVYISLPVVDSIDLVTTLKYSQIQGQLLSTLNTTYGGIDGQTSNLNNKLMVFGTYYANSSDWTANSITVPINQRYDIWRIQLTPVGSDFTVSLVYVQDIPMVNKVIVQSGNTYANTQWFKNGSEYLEIVPNITANLDTLYYQDGVNPGQFGVIKIVDAGANILNVTTEILGKQNYISPNGIKFTNGLKVKFDSDVIPAKYQNSEFYVEGVGDAITLTAVNDLIVSFSGSRSNFDPTSRFLQAATSANLNTTKTELVITTTDVPDGTSVKHGVFPNTSNTNYIVEQTLVLTYPYRGGLNSIGEHTSTTLTSDPIGVTVPGILINGVSNQWYVPGQNGSTWHYDAEQVLINGEDIYGGSTGDAGDYHYRSSKFITANAWGSLTGFTSGYTETDGHSKLIGFAADGYPIYGPYGYANANSSLGGVTRMTSSYTASNTGAYRPVSKTVTVTTGTTGNIIVVSSTVGLNPGMRITINDAGITSGSVWILNNGLHTAVGPSLFTAGATQVLLSSNVTVTAGASLTFEFLAGAFIEDYTYVPGSGTLDQFNGRYGVTPDFPNKTYAYFATVDTLGNPVYPYFVGQSFYGSLEADINTSLLEPDYIISNRSSTDLNPWSRRNRWFHSDVISISNQYNKTTAILDQNYRAKRPIIEFNPNLQMYDFGKRGLAPVDLFDTTITQPFIDIEGASSYYIDDINLFDGMRIIFAADADPLTRGKIWVVNFIDVVGTSTSDPTIIHLTLADDGDVQDNDTVSVFNGSNNGKSFWYHDSQWDEGQAKTGLNQAPKFDVFDNEGVSFSDLTKYQINNNSLAFTGTKLFSYKLGTGSDDPVLGFPLSYKNFNNIGDILFENNFDVDTFSYRVNSVDYTSNVNLGFLHRNNSDSTTTKLNVWTTVVEDSKQYQDISYIYDGINNEFLIDVSPQPTATIPNLKVYVNFNLLKTADYQIYNLSGSNKNIAIDKTLIKDGDKIDILVYSEEISKIGFFEIPSNLNLNAQNTVLSTPTLGELRNHISKLTQNSVLFSGTYPGASNLRDINVEAQGGTMLQQSSPTSLASLFLTDDSMNFVNSLNSASQEYTRFKNKFITTASQSNLIDYSNPVDSVDLIIKQINQVKNKSFPWFYSDMVPHGDNKNTITYTVYNTLLTNYEITNVFSNTELSNQACLVYLNGIQLLYGIDYTFLTTGPGVQLTSQVSLTVGDVITIVEYNDTDGNWIPETPTKLGLYPKFTPKLYVDYTYLTPQTMIQGHDGSLTPAFGDFRDDLILELEKRIYNNIKSNYDFKSFNIFDSKPGKFRDTGYSQSDFNNIVAKGYLPWIGFNRLDYSTNSTYDSTNAFTFNYSKALDVIDGKQLPGSWRACFEYFYDTQRPNTNPWEMLGFSEQPEWWEETYGPAPYTSGNLDLWTDLQNGYIAGGDRAGIDTKFARPGLLSIIPVNENGQLIPPQGLLTSKYNTSDFNRNWAVGQYSPTETAWRNSSEYPFAVQLMMALTQPAKYFALAAMPDKYRYNSELKQYLNTETNRRLNQSDIVINGDFDSGIISRSAGYINWIGDYLTTLGITSKANLKHYISDYTIQLSYRMAGFSGKQYLKVLAEQNSPNSINESILIPDSDFDLILNKSTPVSNPRYSAVIVEKTATGYKLSGYDNRNPYFTVVQPAITGDYKVIEVLSSSVNYYTTFTNYKVSIPYGTEFANVQQIAGFLAGYERYLIAQGFRFDYYDSDLGQIRNWELSIKEFMFWQKQNWPVSSILVLGPAADIITLSNTNAAVDEIMNSYYGSKIMTQNFVVLDSDSYSVLRDGNVFRVNLDTKNGDLIAFADFNLVQYEHVLICNNKTQFNDVIYDPAMGQRQFRLKLVGAKTGGWTGTLTPEGYMYNKPGVPSWRAATDYLRGDLIEYKNFYYTAIADIPGTTDFNSNNWLPVDKNKIKSGLLNNLATNAGAAVNFYDTDIVNLESKFDLYSLGLIGYRNRSYLNDLGLDDTSQVKFYQGFIKEKGTLNAIDALGKVSFTGQDSNVEISEKWAFRVGNYGSLGTNQFVEMVLDENYVLNNPTSLAVLSNNTVVYSSIYSDDTALFKTSESNWAPPFLLNRNSNSNRSDDIQTAGFVNIDDVDYTVFDLNDTASLSTDISNIGVGSIIWAAKDYTQKWNVFRVNENQTNVIEIYNGLDNKLLMVTDTPHSLSIDDAIVINNADTFNGFYRVQTVESQTTFTVLYSGSLTGFSTVTLLCPLYKLSSLRVKYASDITSLPMSTPGWQDDDKVWVGEDSSTVEWAVYNKSSPWAAQSALPRGAIYSNDKFGSTVVLSLDNNFAAAGVPGFSSNVGAIVNYVRTVSGDLLEDQTFVSLANATVNMGSSLANGNKYLITGAPGSSTNRGYAFVYNRSTSGQLTPYQILTTSSASSGKFGYSVAISKDDQWAFVGCPGTDTVAVYGFDSTISTVTQTIIANGVLTSFALSFTPASAELLYVSSSLTSYVPYVDYTITGSTIVFSTAPAASSIVIRQRAGFKYFTTISYSGTGSNFGFSLACSTEGAQVVIGAPLATVTYNSTPLTKSGSVIVYNRSVDNFIAIANQTIFGGSTISLTNFNKVYIDGVLKTIAVDYIIAASTKVQFNTPLTAGQVVTIETNSFNRIGEYTPKVPTALSQFGYSVDICPNNCSVYIGAPYKSTTKYFTGSAYRFLNQGRVYGTITGTVSNPTVNSGDSIRINNFEVVFTTTSLGSVVNAINATLIPGVTASAVNGYLKLDSISTLSADKLRILPGVGSAITDLGLKTFVETEEISNPTGNAYDYFGQKVKINTNSDVLGVGSTEATTIVPTTFDLTTKVTTFDSSSTTFNDPIPSGAVWVLSYLNDSRNNIDHAGKFSFVQQLTLSVLKDLGISLANYVKFGSDFAFTNTNLLVGASAENSIATNGGRIYQFSNSEELKGWDVVRSQTDKVDIDSLKRAYIYNTDTQTILYNLDYIDPAKGKILGQAEQNITYKTDYDPAFYNYSVSSSATLDQQFHWNSTQVGQVWWDLSTVKYIDYEQGTNSYRTANWGRVFPGSSINVYEWVESLYLPSLYVTNGGDGIPKYPDDSAYVLMTHVDPATNVVTLRYYFWVSGKTSVSLGLANRTMPIVTIADYISNPKNSGIKYLAAIKDDAVAVYNVVGQTTGKSIILHIDYATELNSNLIHSEYALLSEVGTNVSSIPTSLYKKLVDSASGIDLFGNTVPDPALSVQNRYGISVRPRQSMFVNRKLALKEMVSYVNTVFAENIISQGFDLTKLSSGEPIPMSESGAYDVEVQTIEELGYLDITSLATGYKVLVATDTSVSGLWTIYTKQSSNTWLLTRSQSYRTTDYWQYIDWYAPGFDKTVRPAYTVNTLADLANLKLVAQDIVKIKNNGQGKWLLLQIFPNVINTIGIESGTIELKSNLYNLSNYSMGYGNDNFDSGPFDKNPNLEIRIIMEALRDDIFINQLKDKFLTLFFVFIYYILDEQKFVDWVFKTSFIDVLHKIKGLAQPQIYSKENQDYYRQYIEEVKPYHTTIREYVIDYQGTDNFTGYVGDFDVPAYYDNTLQMYRSPSGEFLQDIDALNTGLQYRDWLLSYTYSISEITIANGGSGYTSAPTITITGSTIGNDALARATINNGAITGVEILYAGTNYTSQPVITVTGGGGSGAALYARLGNSTTRKMKTTLVYDRLTYGTSVQLWAANTAFTQGSLVSYNQTAYIVDTTFTSGSTFSADNLTVYPAYKLDNANDRIQSYYSPTTGQPGKDFSLLQSGIEYPGLMLDGTTYTGTANIDTTISSLYSDLALGTRSEDIIIDGNAYVSTYSSHAPEELIPGRVYDTMDMKITTLAVNPLSAAYSYWIYNLGFYVLSVPVIDGGRGYSAGNVAVTIQGGSPTTIATASPILDANGSITSITLVAPGYNGQRYYTVPNVVITGSNTSPARAAAYLGQTDWGTFDYRLFKDMNDNWQFLKIPSDGTTTLVTTDALTNNFLQVANASVLSGPDPTGANPGVVYINGERITYWTKESTYNTMTNLRRGTAGTGAKAHAIGSLVVDAGASQIVPSSDNYTWTPNANVTKTTTSGATYTFLANTPYIRSNLWYNTGSTTATDGSGLYNSTKLQVIFVKQS